jgi:hypothetical protein
MRLFKNDGFLRKKSLLYNYKKAPVVAGAFVIQWLMLRLDRLRHPNHHRRASPRNHVLVPQRAKLSKIMSYNPPLLSPQIAGPGENHIKQRDRVSNSLTMRTEAMQRALTRPSSGGCFFHITDHVPQIAETHWLADQIALRLVTAHLRYEF